MKNILLAIIKFYQSAISVHLPPACRYYPTCSDYAYQAVTKYGVLRGGWLALKRILRCHPFHPGGYDPVPAIKTVGTGTISDIKTSLIAAVYGLCAERKSLTFHLWWNVVNRHKKFQ